MTLWLALLVQVDPALPEFKPEGRLEGTLASIGFEPTAFMTRWAEALKAAQPALRIEIEGKGSSTPPPALISGCSHVAPMLRPFSEAETRAFVERHGYPPTVFKAAFDALGVFVHKDHPPRSLTLKEVGAIFSKRGDTFRPLGLNPLSFTRQSFQELALRGREFASDVEVEAGPASILLRCSTDRDVIGYAPLIRATSTVRPLRVEGVEATAENARSGAYPLARPLLLYVNRRPGRPLDPLVREFLRLVLSREGQSIAANEGFVPLSAKQAVEERKKLE